MLQQAVNLLISTLSVLPDVAATNLPAGPSPAPTFVALQTVLPRARTATDATAVNLLASTLSSVCLASLTWLPGTRVLKPRGSSWLPQPGDAWSRRRTLLLRLPYLHPRSGGLLIAEPWCAWAPAGFRQQFDHGSWQHDARSSSKGCVSAASTRSAILTGGSAARLGDHAGMLCIACQADHNLPTRGYCLRHLSGSRQKHALITTAATPQVPASWCHAVIGHDQHDRRVFPRVFA
jgi:hypothetical protein